MTIPDPQEPDQVPPVKDIQFLCPNGVGPTDTRGWSATDIRKSRLRLQEINFSVKTCGCMLIFEEGHLT